MQMPIHVRVAGHTWTHRVCGVNRSTSPIKSVLKMHFGMINAECLPGPTTEPAMHARKLKWYVHASTVKDSKGWLFHS